MKHEMPRKSSYGKVFLVLLLAGLIGVIALVPTAVKQLQSIPGLPEMPFGLLVFLSVLQPMILLVIAVALGTWMAPRVGLTSLIAEKLTSGAPLRSRLRAQLPAALIAGITAAVALPLLDLFFQPWLPASFSTEAPPRDLVFTAGAMLYGGITEELLLRWGMMSVLAWAGWRLFQRGGDRPGGAVFAAALLISAVLFGIGHLGAVAILAPLTPMLILRTILLNAVGGIIFGWLYWKKSLEAAMIAHAVAHLIMTLLSLITG
ncbi:CPBP family intramembrane metalloprotease [Brevibacillus composti]|uniref:CPBP family intramembrane metalloprotease n=1 Tax=Brevibacillus composti TaxID=2796470 RepID=A0A7T5EJ89_9BACL|nr:CPBP family intramembrane glutamic endopeptidase [Brevibacillus composti]QQE73583.1 CPBP family intramembrane metalloprotease [Brevibacillus composti]QUO40665.1 CPBP family intramembrane metalloprotease [Brevibacillus composti]